MILQQNRSSLQIRKGLGFTDKKGDCKACGFGLNPIYRTEEGPLIERRARTNSRIIAPEPPRATRSQPESVQTVQQFQS